MYEIKESTKPNGKARIIVVGVGGAGNNVVDRMIEDSVTGVEFVAMNTDLQDLELSLAPVKVPLGEKETQGLGAGADPEIGERAAQESIDEIRDHIKDANMIFIVCGMGGGTGTGAAPVIAHEAREMGILTVGVMTTPFSIERAVRRENAEIGISKIRDDLDTILIIPNDKLFNLASKSTPIKDMFRLADEVVKQSVRGITDIINEDGILNLDFADIKKAMKDKGTALIGIGEAEGEGRAAAAVKAAVESKLLDSKINSATAIIANVVGNVTAGDIQEVEAYLQELVGERVEFFLGMRGDDSYGEKISVTIIATGIDDNASVHGGFVPRSVSTASSRFGTGHIPSPDSVGFSASSSPSPAPAPSPSITERNVSSVRTVNPTNFSSAGETTGLKSRVKDVHMEVPSFLRKKNDE
ncbi:MAG: cell division protein FtsZ [Lachnospiraceae bacterium]|nr:cell division protein FtsZ [Lachnospiraceae bacterium]